MSYSGSNLYIFIISMNTKSKFQFFSIIVYKILKIQYISIEVPEIEVNFQPLILLSQS